VPRHFSAATCLATAISVALSTASALAMPPPVPLIGAMLVMQDTDEFAAGEDEPADGESQEETADEAPAEDEPAGEDLAQTDEVPSDDAPAPDASEDSADTEPEPESEEVVDPEAAPVAATPVEPRPTPPPAPAPPPAAPVPVTPNSRSAGGSEDREDTTIYKVVVNHEEQYSIWPANRESPSGWTDVGKKTGSKQEALDYIKEVWTDMRPLSLRKKMEEMERQRGGN